MEKDQITPITDLSSLTDDILLRIFSLLDAITLSAVHSVSKKWNQLANNIKCQRVCDNNSIGQRGHISELSDEILLHLFSFLDFISICKASQVCKNWKRVGDDEDLWRYLYSKRWEAVWEIRY
jgi:hypothetical protein